MTPDASARSPSVADVPVRPAPPPSRSFLRRVLDDAFGRWGARLGVAWIGVVAFFAAFAPFVASSHPYYLVRDGHAEFPLFRNLTRPDLIALGVAFAVLLTFIIFRRLGGLVRLGVFVGTVAACALLSLLHTTPELTSLESYRQDQADGFISRVVRAPLPYSARDRFNDSSALMENQPPSRAHPFGTTPNREDVLSRMLHATRIAIQIGFISTGIAVVIGCTIGALMGYFSGWVDIVGMRLIEIFEAVPGLFLIITFIAFYGRNIYYIMAIIGLVGWTSEARFIRAQFLQLRQQDFVHAAVALGLPLRTILFRHMLPNGISPVLVTSSFGVASAILTEAVLSFLGLGLIDEPSWGALLNQARGVGTDFHWWLAVFPGVAIFLTVFAYNLIGEAFRDALDPKLKKRE